MKSSLKSVFQLIETPGAENALFTSLSQDEQTCMCGGFYQGIALPVALSNPLGPVVKSDPCLVQDAQGNCVTLNDLIRYLRRTVG